MRLVTPIWLLLVLPWVTTAIYLLLRRQARTTVPHLPLWNAESGASPPRQRVSKLPLRWILWLLAALMLIAAAAQLRVGRRAPGLRVVFDGDESNLAAYFDRFASLASDVDPTMSLTWVVPPSLQERLAVLKRRRPLPIWIDEQDAAIKDRIKEFATIRIDAKRGSDDATHLSTPAPAAVEVISAAVSTRPRQLMLRLRNNHASSQITVEVDCRADTKRSAETLSLAETKNVFIDLPGVDREMTIRVVDGNNAALCPPRVWRKTSLPGQVIATRQPSEAFRRFAEAYAQIHPSVDDSPKVVMSERLPTDQAGVLIAPAISDLQTVKIQQGAHPLLSHTDLNILNLLPLRVAQPPPNDWQVVATASGHPIVAVRETPVRQVWWGFESETFQQREAFVVFMADIVEWIAEASDVRGYLDANPESVAIADDAAIARAIAAAVGKDRTLMPWFCLLAGTCAAVGVLMRS